MNIDFRKHVALVAQEDGRPVIASEVAATLSLDPAATRYADGPSGVEARLGYGLPIVARKRSAKASITLALMSTEPQSLRPHAFYFFVKCLHFFIAPRALRFRRITGAHLFERFLHGKLGDFSHGDPSYLKTECPTGKLSDDKNGCFLTSHVLRFLMSVCTGW